MKIRRGKRRRISVRDLISKTLGGITDRQWTDPRDGRRWTLWLETGGDWPVLVFGSEGETLTVVVDFEEGLRDLSDEDVQCFLDEAKFRSAELRGIVAELGLPRSSSAEEPGG